MKRTFAAAGLLTAALVTFGADVDACGDKSLSAGGIRWQRARATQFPASILMYMPSASQLPRATRELNLHEMLRQVGHKYREVTTWAELQASLDTGKFNIVLVDFGDFGDLQQKLGSSPTRVVIVPVAYRLTKADATQAAKQSRFLIKAPSGAAQYLGTIAKAVRSRSSIPRRG